MTPADDYAEIQRHLERFETNVPEILRRTKLTAAFAAEVEANVSVAQSRFTLAITGQMKAGKSTLINAIVGADLALVGVNETTATVNWFRHGTPEQARCFRAVWNDVQGSSDLLELHRKSDWSGDSALAERTRYLEFFSPAEFLRKVDVVDTPGLRSTIQSHGRFTQAFLNGSSNGQGSLDATERSEAESLFFGGIADCICYVLPPVVRVGDNEFLGRFAAQIGFRNRRRTTASGCCTNGNRFKRRRRGSRPKSKLKPRFKRCGRMSPK
ncbi:MAG: dynamin family protein [Pirellulales bacterium]